jgi:hypothetical protein
MNRKQNRNLFSLLFGLLLITTACSKTGETEEFVVVGDVYYVSKKVDDKKVTALVFYAFGNKSIREAVVTDPNQQTFLLDKSIENGFTVFKEPGENDYAETYQTQGAYLFELESSDKDKVQKTDELKKIDLAIPEITEIRFETLDNSYDVTWNEVPNAMAFKLNMFDENGTIVFTSDVFGSGQKSFTLMENELGTWTQGIAFGDKYTVQVQAINYDEDAVNTEFDNELAQQFNIQEISIGEATFVWDEN